MRIDRKTYPYLDGDDMATLVNCLTPMERETLDDKINSLRTKKRSLNITEDEITDSLEKDKDSLKREVEQSREVMNSIRKELEEKLNTLVVVIGSALHPDITAKLKGMQEGIQELCEQAERIEDRVEDFEFNDVQELIDKS